MPAVLFCLLLASSMWREGSGAPYLSPAVVLQPYLYLSPPLQLYFPTQIRQQALPTTSQGVVVEADGQEVGQQSPSQPLEEEEEEPVSQFHSEDGAGGVLFGFHGPNQARMEARDPLGRVHGSYSYLDPAGQLVKMEYWDEGKGFHARGNSLPRSFFDVPSYTPEVQAAREQHFKLYQQVLMSTALASGTLHSDKDPYPYVEKPTTGGGTPTSQEEDDTVEVGQEDNGLDDSQSQDGLMPSNNYPGHGQKYPGSQEYPLSQEFPASQEYTPSQEFASQEDYPAPISQEDYPSQEDDEDRESVVLDNPELARGRIQSSGEEGRARRGKSHDREETRGFSYYFSHPLNPVKLAGNSEVLSVPHQLERFSLPNSPQEPSAIHDPQAPSRPSSLTRIGGSAHQPGVSAVHDPQAPSRPSPHTRIGGGTGLYQPAAVHDPQAPSRPGPHTRIGGGTGLHQPAAVHDPQAPSRPSGLTRIVAPEYGLAAAVHDPQGQAGVLTRIAPGAMPLEFHDVQVPRHDSHASSSQESFAKVASLYPNHKDAQPDQSKTDQ